MTEKNKILLFNLLKEKGNDQCAECGGKGSVPDWASENLGVFLCVDCSGKHRSLGKQISFVRSLRLDNWADDKCEVIEFIFFFSFNPIALSPGVSHISLSTSFFWTHF